MNHHFLYFEWKVIQMFEDDDVKSIFKGAPVLFKDMKVFTEKYVPDRLPGREEQVKELAKVFRYALKGVAPPNVFIYGKFGTGKSVVTRFVLQELEKYVQEERMDHNVGSIYISCHNYRTEGQVIEKIVQDLNEKFNTFNKARKPKLKGWGIDRYYEEFKKTLKELGGVYIIVLDEIDRLKSPNSVLYALTRVDVPEAEVSVVGITNSLKFAEYLEGSVLSSLRAMQLVFPPYNAEQLEEILRDRARLGLREGVLEEGVIELCAAIAAQGEGDARRAIELLRTAVRIAEDEKKEIVTIEHVKKAVDVIEKDIIHQTVSTFTPQGKIVLLSIVACVDAGYNQVRSGDMYKAYQIACKMLGIEPYTQRRVSDLVRELETLNLVNTVVASKGRYGRARFIDLGAPVEYYKSVLLQDDYISRIDYSELVRIIKQDIIKYKK